MAYIQVLKTNSQVDVVNAIDILEKRLKEELKNTEGKVWVIPSVNIYTGTRVHDIDLLLMGYLENFTLEEVNGYKNIQFQSFCILLEVKNHDVSRVFFNGTNLYVSYYDNVLRKDHESNVSHQSEKQKESIKKFFKLPSLPNNSKVPYISNLIWLIGVPSKSFDQHEVSFANVIYADSSIEDIFHKVASMMTLRSNGYFNAFRDFNKEEIQNIANLFYARKNGADIITLRRMNHLNGDPELLKKIVGNPNQTIVLSGRAGTGKTLILLNAAKLLLNHGKKCLFLTFNNALISDLEHTISFIPDFPELPMESMHSLMIKIMAHQGMWNKEKNINTDFLPSLEGVNYKKAQPYLKYDYILIDEAQDWDCKVLNLIKNINPNIRLIVAEGVDQFMINSDSFQWEKPTFPRLKICLRQKKNLTLFVKAFAQKLGISWNVDPNDEFPGGHVDIYYRYNDKIHRSLLQKIESDEAKPYDLMLLASNSLIDTEGESRFLLLDDYKRAGFKIYDGISHSNRKNGKYTSENSKNNECRLFSYESCRGLEAWITVCLRYDELFTRSHPHDYSDMPYRTAQSYMKSIWALIPLTRAIDNLVIVIRDPETEIAGIFKELAKEYPDFITFRKNNLEMRKNGNNKKI